MNANTIKLLLLSIFTVSMSCSDSTKQYQITYERGVDELGYPTKIWIDVMRGEVSQEKLAQMINTSKELSESEIEWVHLIQSRFSEWEKQFDDIAIPFSEIQIPNQISIVCGNSGNKDAFASKEFETKIFFNLSILFREYGSAKKFQNQDRIDRLFAHEFTHLLQYQWFKKNPFSADTHFKKALLICFMEGFGHYRSLSSRWRTTDGKMTQHAESTLGALEHIFVKRISALRKARDEDVAELMTGITTGRFDKKWGALTVALWLVKESNGDDAKLRKWVNLGPEGIIQLARKYLPEKLKIEFESNLES